LLEKTLRLTYSTDIDTHETRRLRNYKASSRRATTILDQADADALKAARDAA